MKYRGKYTYEIPFTYAVHTWAIIRAADALHLHITDYGEDWIAEYGYRYQGGIEAHYRYPPEYMSDQPPSHDHCHILQAPCWHDGSSLQVEEFWIPFLGGDFSDHKRIWEMMNTRHDPPAMEVLASLTKEA